MTMAADGTRVLSRISLAAYPREILRDTRLAVRTSAQSVRSHPVSFRLEFRES